MEKELKNNISVETLTEKGKLILSKDILRKIKYTCDKINNVEWSGVMFYSFTGNITQPSTIECTIKDLFVMDKGTHAHTQFKYTEDILDILQEKPELEEECIMSMCHSHAGMSVFFSGEDIDELKINAPGYNQYLSVIVNNKGDICAKIAFISTQLVKSDIITTFKDSNGNEVTYNKELTEEKDVLYTINLDIIREEDENFIEDFFIKRVDKIIEDDKRREIVKNQLNRNATNNSYIDLFNQNSYQEYCNFRNEDINIRPSYNKNSNTVNIKKEDCIMFLNMILSENTDCSKKVQEIDTYLKDLAILSPEEIELTIESEYDSSIYFVLGDNYELSEETELIKGAIKILDSFKIFHPKVVNCVSQVLMSSIELNKK